MCKLDFYLTGWQREIGEITNDVEDLLYGKYQIEELERIIKGNSFVIGKIGTFL